MAGGVGSRFWPLSRAHRPKQFLDILGTGKSFIRSTFERFLPLVPPENFVVVTNANYKGLVMQQLPELGEHQVLCEPERHNTAPCIAYAANHIFAECPDATMVVSPADHLVTNEVEFQRVIERAFNFVDITPSALMTIGIAPTRPETGYGYIEARGDKADVMRVDNFKEKPDLETAKRFLAEGTFFWNSGIFVWSVPTIMKAIRSLLPEVTSVMDDGKDVWGTADEQAFIDHNFCRCPSVSIDYGVMEHYHDRYTIAADFGWSDIGTWGSLYVHSAHDEHGNAVQAGKVEIVDTHNSIVNIDPSVQAIVQGLDNCLVAFRDGALLVCRIDDEQSITKWVERL